MVSVLGIIPARGGSKGIPGKNNKLLCGKPLIQYTLEAALESNLSDLIVSTDDDDVRQIALKFGVKVITRPPELAGDTVPTRPVLVHALQSSAKAFDAVMTLQPTSPLRTVLHINQSLSLFQQHPQADSLVSVVRVPHNYLPMSLMKKDGPWLNHFDDNASMIRRQEKPVLYARNGAAVYITRVDKLNEFIVGGNILAYEMTRIESIDIDDMEDWVMAEIIINHMLKKEID
jgi:CMP-N,N'-diacetyllegionaminic acid synthase